MSVLQSSTGRYQNFFLEKMNFISKFTSFLDHACTCLSINFNKSFKILSKKFQSFFFSKMKSIVFSQLCYIRTSTPVFLLVSRTNKQRSRLMSSSCVTQPIIVSQFYLIIRLSSAQPNIFYIDKRRQHFLHGISISVT